MGFFFSDDSGLSEHEAEEIIKGINLNEKERNYVRGKLDQRGSGKLNRYKIEQLYKDLSEDTDDGIHTDKARQIRDSLLNALKKD